LHRDLSPSNVRLTIDGHCKLLDFGALVPFGVASNIVGTPPLIAPEAVHGGALDQRTDLYALGALAYWLLTSRHAYPARSVEELPDTWLAPLAPPYAPDLREDPRELLQRFANCEHPLLHGLLHEARAYVCWEAKRVAEYEHSLAQVERWFRPPGTPALIAKCARLAALSNTTKSQHRVLNRADDRIALDMDTVATDAPDLREDPRERQ
jgi:serine/threonine protein kinase